MEKIIRLEKGDILEHYIKEGEYTTDEFIDALDDKFSSLINKIDELQEELNYKEDPYISVEKKDELALFFKPGAYLKDDFLEEVLALLEDKEAEIEDLKNQLRYKDEDTVDNYEDLKLREMGWL